MARVPLFRCSIRPRQGRFHNFIPISVFGLPWCFDWCWDFDHKPTTVPATDADMVNLGERQWGWTRVRNLIWTLLTWTSQQRCVFWAQLQLGTCNLLTVHYTLPIHLPDDYGKKWILGFIRPIGSLLIYHPFAMCNPLFERLKFLLGSDIDQAPFFIHHQFLESFVVPKILNGLFLQPISQNSGYTTSPIHTSFPFFNCFLLFS